MLEHLYDGPNGDLFKKMDEFFESLEKKYPEIYCDIEMGIYTMINGHHFNEEMLNKALNSMYNDDGTRGAKWTLSDTNDVASSNGITFDHFNQYDWCYVMNMIHSDYSEVLGDSLSNYVKMAKKFIMDKDAPDGKALRYYWAMKKDTY